MMGENDKGEKEDTQGELEFSEEEQEEEWKREKCRQDTPGR